MSPFRSRLARLISPSLEAGRTQLGQAEGEEVTVDEYLQEAGLEAWTVLCHGHFLCLVAPARLFACDEMKKNASYESRFGGTDYEAKQIIMTVCLILDEVTRGPPCQHFCMSW